MIKNRRLLGIGSSLTRHNTYNASTHRSYNARGPLHWANILLGQRCQVINNGISGESSTQVAARIEADILAYNPGIVAVQIGTNNIVNWERVIVDTKRVYDAVLASGAVLLALAEPHRDLVASNWDAEEQKNADQVNEWRIRYCEEHGNAYFVDSNKYLVDVDDADGNPVTNSSYDGTHFSKSGAFLWGYAIRDVLANIVPPQDIYLNSPLVADGTDLTHGVVSLNPSLQGTGGSAGTGGSGTVPTSWRIERNSGTAGTIAGSISAGTGIEQINAFTMAITPGAVAEDELFYLRTSPADTTVVPGGVYEAVAQVEVGAYGGYKEISVEINDNTNSFHAADLADDGQSTYMPAVAWTGTLRTPPYQIPDGVTSVRLRMNMKIDGNVAGTPSVKVKRIFLRRLA